MKKKTCGALRLVEGVLQEKRQVDQRRRLLRLDLVFGTQCSDFRGLLTGLQPSFKRRLSPIKLNEGLFWYEFDHLTPIIWGC